MSTKSGQDQGARITFTLTVVQNWYNKKKYIITTSQGKTFLQALQDYERTNSSIFTLDTAERPDGSQYLVSVNRQRNGYGCFWVPVLRNYPTKYDVVPIGLDYQLSNNIDVYLAYTYIPLYHECEAQVVHEK